MAIHLFLRQIFWIWIEVYFTPFTYWSFVRLPRYQDMLKVSSSGLVSSEQDVARLIIINHTKNLTEGQVWAQTSGFGVQVASLFWIWGRTRGTGVLGIQDLPYHPNHLPMSPQAWGSRLSRSSLEWWRSSYICHSSCQLSTPPMMDELRGG